MSFPGDDTTYDTQQRALGRIMEMHASPKKLYQVAVEGVIERDSEVQAQAVYTYLQQIMSEFPEVKVKVEAVEMTVAE